MEPIPPPTKRTSPRSKRLRTILMAVRSNITETLEVPPDEELMEEDEEEYYFNVLPKIAPDGKPIASNAGIKKQRKRCSARSGRKRRVQRKRLELLQIRIAEMGIDIRKLKQQKKKVLKTAILENDDIMVNLKRDDLYNTDIYKSAIIIKHTHLTDIICDNVIDITILPIIFHTLYSALERNGIFNSSKQTAEVNVLITDLHDYSTKAKVCKHEQRRRTLYNIMYGLVMEILHKAALHNIYKMYNVLNILYSVWYELDRNNYECCPNFVRRYHHTCVPGIYVSLVNSSILTSSIPDHHILQYLIEVYNSIH